MQDVSFHHSKQFEDHILDIAVVDQACVEGRLWGGQSTNISGPKIKSATEFLRDIAT